MVICANPATSLRTFSPSGGRARDAMHIAIVAHSMPFD